MEEFAQFLKDNIFVSEKNNKEFSKWLFKYDHMKEETY
jgi:hypothetical protein